MVEVKQQLPEGLYQGSTASGKVENLTLTQSFFLIESSVLTCHTSLGLRSVKEGNQWVLCKMCKSQEGYSQAIGQRCIKLYVSVIKMVVTSIKNKQVKIQGAAATTQLGVLDLTNKLVKELANQSEVITDKIAQRTNHTSHDIKQASEQIEQDVNWMKDCYRVHSCEFLITAWRASQSVSFVNDSSMLGVLNQLSPSS
ncbi:hypothetical protein PGT21_018162 [Puccinia graminis f. sp. tritici]|uniref:Uncharacterized protein n=1 Tax=Puccinia graminis f. sp. tritici TaxID=56615 RepID=A0A5B0LXS6_PUCGR|nr:hypothetical protein PGT21_018162 [Puccinia graminis f. sp. tritici]